MDNLTLVADRPAQPGVSRTELDDIVYRISHDLRASVRALKELPGWLEDDLVELGVDIGDASSETMGLIQSHARRLDEMLSGLLAYSRVGRLQEIQISDPSEVFQRVLQELAPPTTAAFFTQFNPVTVRMGSSDVAKVFHILVDNAIRHTSEPEQRIEITSCRSGDVWELLVSDNGPGIASKNTEDVFKPMVKLVSRDEDEGGGMGLAILRKITETYGGSVHLEPRRRRGGSTFRVRMPVLA